MYTKKFPIRCSFKEITNDIQYVKLQDGTKANTEALYILCRRSFIVQTIHRIPNVSPGLILGVLYSKGCLS